MVTRRTRSHKPVSLRTEKDIEREAMAALELAYPKPYAWWSRNNSGGRTRRMGKVGLGVGSADIVGCVSLRCGARYSVGVFVAVEMKTPTGKQSEDQVAWELMHEKCGGIYVLATSAQEALDKVSMRLEELHRKVALAA